MIDFKCTADACPQANQTFTFYGDLDSCECGGCGVKLEPFNPRPDPEKTENNWP